MLKENKETFLYDVRLVRRHLINNRITCDHFKTYCEQLIDVSNNCENIAPLIYENNIIAK